MAEGRSSTVESTTSPFGPDVVAAIQRHMNTDHAADCVLICRGLGGQLETTQAEVVDVDGSGIEFRAVVAGETVPVRIPWSIPITERSQVRAEVVRMYREACAVLGVQPRSEAEA